MPELPSPLQLDDYRLLRAHVDAADEVPEATAQTIETQLTRGSHKDAPLRWRVDLEVRFGKDGEEITAPYHGEVRIVAFFTIHPDYPEERRASLVELNGASIVYGVIREVISNLTARGPNGMYILPSISFYKTESDGEEE